MKAILVSVFLVIAINTKADQQTTMGIGNSSAPTFANLQLESISRNMTTINPSIRLIADASLTFNQKSLQLTIHRETPPCPPERLCPRYMPPPVQIKLTVYKVEHGKCSVKYTAGTPANVLSELQEQVVLEDFSMSKCAVTLQMPYRAGVLTYQARGVSSLTKQTETASARFTIEKFIKAQN